MSSIANRFISRPLISGFAEAYPAVQIDLTITDDEFDIVAEGSDTGAGLGEVIDQDMIAVPVSGEHRQCSFTEP